MDDGGPVVPSRRDGPFSASRPPSVSRRLISVFPHFPLSLRISGRFPVSFPRSPVFFPESAIFVCVSWWSCTGNGRPRCEKWPPPRFRYDATCPPQPPAPTVPRPGPLPSMRRVLSVYNPLGGRVPPFCSLSLSCPTLAIDPNPHPFDITRERFITASIPRAVPSHDRVNSTLKILAGESWIGKTVASYSYTLHTFGIVRIWKIRFEQRQRILGFSAADFLSLSLSLFLSLSDDWLSINRWQLLVKSSPSLTLTRCTLFQEGFKNVLSWFHLDAREFLGMDSTLLLLLLTGESER